MSPKKSNSVPSDSASFEAAASLLIPVQSDAPTEPADKPAGHTLDREDPYYVPPGANLDTYWKKPDTPN